ncbi:TIGR02391 family protein [Actinophytocola algeriensis]|uniref:Conserved hypothetical protein CHP02391 domain-containing protein n=1 Tax=Actinophytocola algeriensis TaxID=1768010 RepID=A0A7W7QCN4_9PSEU|nr:TIGR02391 family protein [Actinophytocola algeriensis]MBB4910691.1 hypothetical protein [Actinophytocola algeriensis]MBE1473684.1 hypothetical protein [Actinophytocola algeriensis]
MITAIVLATTVISVFATPGGTGQRERKGVTGVDHGSAVNATDQGLLQLIYDLMSQRGDWPTFTAVDLRADRDLGVEDAQAALLAIPEGYISRPWQAHGFSDRDAVRLTLRGVTMCAGGRQDLDLSARFVAWVVKVESEASDDGETPLVAKSVDFAAYLELPLGSARPGPVESAAGAESDTETEQSAPAQDPDETPDFVRTRAALSRMRVLVDLLPHFWIGVNWQQEEPWLWELTIDRRRLRPYRRLQGPDALLEYAESVERERVAAQNVNSLRQGSVNIFHGPVTVQSALTEVETGVPTGTGDLDVLLPILRAEITEVSADLVRANRFDDAIFAAFRRVEHELQQRTQNAAIGNELIKAAFVERREPIRVTVREQDKDRLVELFSGAIGLFKGDRSHKDRPLLPCRSRYECMRLLAHASTLLDLLDRDIDRAPIVRGYEHRQGHTLTLWVDRASSQVEVWLDETTRLDKLSYRPGTLVVDVARVAPGEHRIHLADGHRQGAAHTVWLTSEPGLSSWYRVIEVNLPLYGDAEGEQRLDVSGVRLYCLEAGTASERILPTREVYTVGHYVSWHWSSTAAIGGAWVGDRDGGSLRKLWEVSTLFEGQPVAPAHPIRLMHISMEPSRLRLRIGAKTPLRVLAHLTDGTARWTEPLDDPKVETGDEKTVFYKGGAVIAKAPGATTLRCLHAGCSTEASVEIASHPRGTVTELLTGLPPVAGIASTAKGLVVSTRGTQLWRVGREGVYRLIAAVPRMPTVLLGTDTLAARADGELAVRITGIRELQVLHHHDEYATSHIVNPDCLGTPMAFVWDNEDLIVAMDSGTIHRVAMDSAATQLASFEGVPIAVACSADDLLVLCGPRPDAEPPQCVNLLWRIPHGQAEGVNLLAHQGLTELGGVAYVGDDIYVSDFRSGRVLRLPHDQTAEPVTVADGLVNPNQLTSDVDGTLYIADWGAGAIHQILP